MQTDKSILALTKDLLLIREFEWIGTESGVPVRICSGSAEMLDELGKTPEAESLLLIEISGAGREGIELAGTVREQFPRASMIAYSKLIAPDTVRRAKNAGIQHIISQQQMLEMLPKLLESLAG